MVVDQVRFSLRDTVTGAVSDTQIALAFVFLVLLMLAVGVVTADLMTNVWGTTGPRDFHHH